MSNKIYLSCEEANHTCDKAQYKEATLWEKIKLNFHLAFCAACRKYSSKNAKLTKLVTNKPVKLDATEKSKLQSAFKKELAKQNN
ncbi:glycine dehydrogenase [Lacinutrix sp. Bg11-31]|uniref:glycine dehydrogenase n=1 Tax=Lacinutrix sp. Bg11-31 TaxID=2057808 RepID=UPI000C3192DE|nr:glycine dehydrogenase [Lacinutrix sp. Bg11-31]AUC83398.1 glycine dehydrogenase [Lacinutrix sp. Bg11-31]